MIRRPLPPGLPLGALLVLGTLVPAGRTATATAPRLDPSQVVGPEACAECHEEEFEVWRRTAHARLYASEEPLHRRARAREIAGNLGVRLIKHDSLCLSCHFTPTRRTSRVTALAGVSCESCHGAARDWITVHNTWEGRRVRRAEETPEDRRARIERNVSLGMYTPARIHELASRCYGCHMVPEEELVAVGGHTSGGSFDLAERIDAIRHNFVTTGREGNAPLSAELRRKLAVLGPALEVEHGLRALAAAEEPDGPYARTLAERVERAGARLAQLARVAPVPELEAIRSAAGGLRLEGGNAAELRHAAGAVAEAAGGFSRAHDGSRLAALDGVGGGAAGGEPEDRDAVLESLLASAGGSEEEPAEAGGAGGSGGGGAAPAEPPPPAIPAVEGEIKTRIRPAVGTTAAVVGPYECGSCHHHSRQSAWWRGDAHHGSAGPLLRRSRRAVEIATLYYGKPAGDVMVKGAAVCMDCHGTVPAGEAAWEVADGVSCEHCHGPAGEYVRSHQEVGEAERRRLGMVDLGDPATRATVCASCHHVTDRRLLASGHPPGTRDFDLAARSRNIEHWDRSQPPAQGLATAYARVLQERGPVPSVQVARLDPSVLRGAGGRDDGGASAQATGAVSWSDAGGLEGGSSGGGEPWVPTARPAGLPGTGAGAGELDLAPLPEDAAERPLDELLLLIEERLEALAGAAGGKGGR